MTRSRIPPALVAAAALVLLNACDDPSAPTPPPARDLLRVTAVDVLVAESFPLQVRAEVMGEVPNVCTALGPIRQQRDGRTITVTIPIHATSQACILLLPPPVQLSLPLDGPFDRGDYLLLVNGFERRFRI